MNETAWIWTASIALGLTLLAVGVLSYAVALYNGLVQVRHQVDQAWANTDVLLRQRHDELPALIGAASGYAAHEQGLLGDVAALRAQACDLSAHGPQRLAAEQALTSRVGRLLALAEGQPQLHADASFGELHERVAALESQIAQRRSFYNDAVNLNNLRCESIPDRWFASLARLSHRPLFAADPVERADAEIGNATPR